ncbi:MAG: ATP-binding protein [Pseudomonadota bacterium]
MTKKPTYQELEQKILCLEKQKALKTSDRRFREIIEDVSEISIQGYDENRNVIFWNQASEKVYGYTQDEALGKKLENLIVPSEMREYVIQIITDWLEKGEKIPSGELLLVDKFGKDVPVFSSHVMHETPFGKELFCIDIDMRPIKQSEEEKKNLQAQLRQSQKMEAIGTLAGGIAHDFNNILQAISGFTDLMILNKKENDSNYQNLMEIRNAADRAKDLIGQLLLFSRKADTKKRPVNINQCVKQTKRMLDKTIPKMIKIETHLADDLWNTYVDAFQIEQVILNLGSNAADAMPDGGKLTITTSNVIFDETFVRNNLGQTIGKHVLLTVADTGQGMDKDILKNIFEPFFTTKGIGKGTGLGLASVYGIVKNHQGHITCESEPGKGTAFKIYLPILKYEEEKLSEKESKLEHGTETILVVDDEQSVRKFVSKTLQQFGYKTIEASNGEEAFLAYADPSNDIDLVLLDINMPGRGGYNSFQNLLKIDPYVRVIISSGYQSQTYDEDDFQQKASGYLKKPYKVSELLKQLRDALS